MPNETESVKLQTEQVDRVRQYVAVKKMITIGGYISNLIKKDMDRIDKRKKPSKQ